VAKVQIVTLRLIIGALLFSYGGVGFAQIGSSPEKTALKSIDKHRWQKAEIRLRKTLEKDTVNPAIRYVLSVFFFHPDNPAFQVDSAYHYAVTALQDYGRAPLRARDRLKRISIDSLGLIGLRARIDSTAFELARSANTEAAYLEFLSHFPSAMQRDLAAQLRDEVAYQDALKQNTHHAFLQYMKRYPQAQRAGEARENYEKLLYQAETRDQRLSSFEKFLADHPESPYRKEVYRNIYEISTAEGTVESFLVFMTRYPMSALVKRAGNMIFHLLADEDNPRWPVPFLTDSLTNLLALKHTYLLPVFQNDRYGFIDENGREVIAPQFRTIHQDYLCGRITDEVLMVNDSLIGRDGALIYNGSVVDLSDLGIGFLKVTTDQTVKIIHKSGFLFQDSITDARIISRRYIAVKKKDAWLLYTLTGKLLADQPWDDITALQNVVVFKNGDKVYIAPSERLARSAEGIALQVSEPFDEVKPWMNGMVWGRAGEYQGVLNQSLHRVIGFDKHLLTQTFFGATAKTPGNVLLYNDEGKRSPIFEQVRIAEPWVAVQKNHSWFLFEPHMLTTISRAYDSVRAEGPFMVGSVRDSVYIHFPGKVTKGFHRPMKISFVPGKDSTSFIFVEESPRQKKLFDLRGHTLFSGAFDGLEYAGEGVFVITKKDKKGLVDANGEILLSPEFDAIGSVKDNVVSLLKNKRFGAYHIRDKKLVKTLYDQNIQRYSDHVIFTFKNGYYGFMSWDNRPVSAFVFDEIRVWGDTLALVRKGSLWSLYDIYARRDAESNLRSVSMIKNAKEEKIAIVQKDNNFGVISNRRQVIIPVTFSDVINLGSVDEPLYFTEKHIREAALFIVIYYDRFGDMLRKEIYDSAADYDKIYCSDH
jgi:hypothetical protein